MLDLKVGASSYRVLIGNNVQPVGDPPSPSQGLRLKLLANQGPQYLVTRRKARASSGIDKAANAPSVSFAAQTER